MVFLVFFFKQKTAYEVRISDWSSDVCSSDLIASLMVAKLEAGVGVSQDFYFTAHDLFRVTGVNGSARSYARLSDALERLQGTQIKTNIEAGGEGQAGFFSWLSEAQLHYTKTKTGDKRLKAVKVRLCDWLYRAILRDRRVLDYRSEERRVGEECVGHGRYRWSAYL